MMVASNSQPLALNDSAEPAEQRAAPRYTLMLRQARLLTAQGQFLCVVRDISQTGVRVKIFHPLPACTDVRLEIIEARPIPLEQVWANDEEAGFRFAGPIDLAAFLAHDPQFPRRQFRVDLDVPIQVSSGLVRVEATSINISQQGACIRSPASFARFQLVKMESEILPTVHAKVLWRQGKVHGLVFEDTFTFREFAMALGRLHGLPRS
ncbi:PilZ domain-containing protein [Erythrobacter litoralis]|uniref:PilZ domain-containing protein n=1 Tax=Erythrobacter litoralis (strain HTCC2594) TaxID=314225 RepID=Q2N6V5_ERYLH|nr:PilZ domain-containing protein [Erythrobacter litoralis]ABC64586.1 hypothetical protein ELI_12470 [Erythrobacter litoralis HTCC2594]